MEKTGDLTFEEFCVLAGRIDDSSTLLETIAQEERVSLDALKEAVSSLEVAGCVDENGAVTSDGVQALEPYRARRAVLLASGLGTRMLPITINTPKPLVRVNGRRIIESLLDALMAIDIKEIYIVVGHLGEQFELLKRDYPGITVVYNPLYDSTNNISSATAVKDCFQNCYAFESDLFLENPNLIRKYRYHSGYLGVPVESTPDWCFDVEDDIIRDLHKGGRDCYHMYGISYWTAEDGLRLSEDLAVMFGREECIQRFWDDVPCVLCRDNYELHIFPCTFDDISEIDSLEELQQIDSAYKM